MLDLPVLNFSQECPCSSFRRCFSPVALQDNDGYCDKSGVHDDAKQMHVFAAIIGAGIPGIN